MNRLPLLDVTRWFAALFVVMFHYIYMVEHIRVSNPVISMLSHYGYLAVQLFFIISGYVIFMSVDNNRNPLKFVTSRFIRLYPAYILSVFFTFLFIAFLPSESEFTASDLLANFTMIPDLLGFKPANTAYWSLAIEILFYSMIAMLLFFTKDVNKIFGVLVFWFALSVVNLFYPLGFLQKVLALKYASLFVGGAAIYLYMKNKDLYSMMIAGVTIPVSIAYALIHSQKLAQLFNYFSFSSFVVAALIVVFYAWIYVSVSYADVKLPVNNKIVSLMAGSSYVLYLIHETIGKYMIRAYSELGIGMVAFMIVIMVVLSVLINLYLEKPVISVLKGIFAGRFARKPAI